MKINHHFYIIPGIVDGQKCHEQAQRMRDDYRSPEPSVVHHHQHREECNDQCIVYEVPK